MYLTHGTVINPKFMRTILLSLTFFIGLSINAQSFIPPKTYKFKSAEDYKKANEKIIECCKWLIETPYYKYSENRVSCNRYFLSWAEGSPDATLVIYSYVATLSKKNPFLLMVYLADNALQQLESPEEKPDEAELGFHSTKTVLKYYQDNIEFGLKKNRKLKKLSALSDEELKSWIAENE